MIHHYNIIRVKDFVKPLQRINKEYIKMNETGTEIDLKNLFIKYKGITIYLSKQPCNYGGYRYYFHCPCCGKRVYKLMENEGMNNWACGTCHNINRFTLNRTKTDCCYYWGRAEEEAKKIDSSYRVTDGYVGIEYTFPDKPKYMKRETYNKHKNRFLAYCNMGNKAWFTAVGRILGRR